MPDPDSLEMPDPDSNEFGSTALKKSSGSMYNTLAQVLLINTGVGDRLVNERTRDLLLEEPDNAGYVPPLRVGQAVKWSGRTLCLIIVRSGVRCSRDANERVQRDCSFG